MPTRTARTVGPRRRVATTAAAIAGALTLTLAPAHAATHAAEPRDAVSTTDRLLFAETLPVFVATRASAERPTDVDWSSDGCSNVPDAPLGYDFTKACWRHDFGYRNYKLQSRFTEPARLRIDRRFRTDMYTLCGPNPLCRTTADLYYAGVREFAG